MVFVFKFLIRIQMQAIVDRSFKLCMFLYILLAWAQFGGGHGGRVPPLFQTGGT